MIEMNPHEVAETVRRYLKDRHPGGATLNVIEQNIRKEEFAWHIPIQPDFEPERMFEYHETLADVEIALADGENLSVFLIPGTPQTELTRHEA